MGVSKNLMYPTNRLTPKETPEINIGKGESLYQKNVHCRKTQLF